LSRTEEEVKVLREVAMQFEVQKKEVATLQEQLRRAAAEKAQMSDVFIRFYSIGLSVPMSGAVAAFLLVHSAAARADQHSYAQEMRRLQDVEVQLKTLQAGSLRASSAGKVFLSLCIFVYLYF
jgi:DNA polymerase III delta subunit